MVGSFSFAARDWAKGWYPSFRDIISVDNYGCYLPKVLGILCGAWIFMLPTRRYRISSSAKFDASYTTPPCMFTLPVTVGYWHNVWILAYGINPTHCCILWSSLVHSRAFKGQAILILPMWCYTTGKVALGRACGYCMISEPWGASILTAHLRATMVLSHRGVHMLDISDRSVRKAPYICLPVSR